MSKLKNILDPKLAKFILERCHITKNRSAYWFFTKDIRRKSVGKLNTHKMSTMWHNLEPESKRLYFTMAELDDVRYKDQRSSWVAEISSLIMKHGDQISKMKDSVSGVGNEQELLKLLDKYQRNYGKMIQADSTSKLYKDIIDKNDSIDLNMTAEKLISTVPENFRSVLSRPRRPPCPFALYTWLKRDDLMKSRGDSNVPFLRFAAKEWASLSETDKAFFNQKYEQLMTEYEKAKKEYKENGDQESSYLEEASKEKKAFRKSIKKRLKDNGVLPVNIRNAFNFFLMDNKDVPLIDLTKIWRSLPEEEKLKYRKMSEEDSKRYYNDLSPDLIKSLTRLLSNQKRSSQAEEKT